MDEVKRKRFALAALSKQLLKLKMIDLYLYLASTVRSLVYANGYRPVNCKVTERRKQLC
jgi:hypothetical protein